jgi:hypothetical protein
VTNHDTKIIYPIVLRCVFAVDRGLSSEQQTWLKVASLGHHAGTDASDLGSLPFLSKADIALHCPLSRRSLTSLRYLCTPLQRSDVHHGPNDAIYPWLSFLIVAFGFYIHGSSNTYDMRLLQRSDDGTFSLVEYYRDILSHRWYEASEEVNLADIMDGTGRDKRGYSKLTFCANCAAEDSLNYFWVDTCCIDKTNSVELQEAINSMFRWYSHAAQCYVYMNDVLHDNNTTQPFHESVWFTRGWTLQELIAPFSVDFFDQRGQWIGSKFSLLYELVTITGVPGNVLFFKGFLKYYTTKDRSSWASRRVTTREEDEAYCSPEFSACTCLCCMVKAWRMRVGG